MIVQVAHEFGEGAVALHIEADVVLIGHADPAVHLDPFLDRQACRLAGLGLGHRNHQLSLFGTGIEQLLRLDHRRTGNLQL